MKRVLVLFWILIFVGMVSGCNYNRVADINANAERRLKEAGFSIVAKEGTQMGIYGGKVWYILQKKDSSGLYDACLSYMQSGDLGIYELKSIDSVTVSR